MPLLLLVRSTHTLTSTQSPLLSPQLLPRHPSHPSDTLLPLDPIQAVRWSLSSSCTGFATLRAGIGRPTRGRRAVTQSLSRQCQGPTYLLAPHCTLSNYCPYLRVPRTTRASDRASGCRRRQARYDDLLAVSDPLSQPQLWSLDSAPCRRALLHSSLSPDRPAVDTYPCGQTHGSARTCARPPSKRPSTQVLCLHRLRSAIEHGEPSNTEPQLT